MVQPVLRFLAGHRPYERCVEAMHERAAAIAAGAPPEIWVLEHAPVISAGRQTGEGEIFAPADVAVVRTDRGGKATWHGPGQLVIYPLLRVADYRLGVRRWVQLLLQTGAQSLEQLGIVVRLDEDAIGLYTARGKIASLGIHVERGVSTHGVSLNVQLQPNGFQWIDPCGVRGGAVDQISAYRSDVSVRQLADIWLAQLSHNLAAMG